MGIEDKKKQLGVNRMEFHEQKELYKDFVDVGGKIVEIGDDPKAHLNKKIEKWIETKEDKEKNRLLEEERLRQAELLKQKVIEEKEKIKKAYKQKEDITQKAEKKPVFTMPSQPKEPHPAQDMFARLAAKLVCILYGIFNLTGSKFSRSFFALNSNELTNNLVEAKKILASVLHQDKQFSLLIRGEMAATGYPYYYELLYRMDALYDEELFGKIRELRQGGNEIARGKALFVKLFKKILLLNRYGPSLTNAIDKALTLEKQKKNITDAILHNNLRKMARITSFLFYRYFPKILNLVDFYHKDEIAGGKESVFKDFLAMTEADTLGYLTRVWDEEDLRERLQKEEEEKKRILDEQLQAEREAMKEADDTGAVTQYEEEEIEHQLAQFLEPLKGGIRLIRRYVDFNDIMDFYRSNKDARMVLPVGDKVFLAQTLLEHFDKEFSFLFLTSSVQYNIFFDRGTRRDMRNNLKDLYFRIDEANKKGFEYTRIISELRKVNSNDYMNSREQFARIQQLTLQRSQISRNIRNQIKDLSADFIKLLKIILEDYENEKHIIQNPEEMLSFDIKIAGKKISHKQKVIEVFGNAFDFATALEYLTSDGELGGNGLTLRSPIFMKVRVSTLDEKELETQE